MKNFEILNHEQRKDFTSEQTIKYFKQLREYYLSLPFESGKVNLQELVYKGLIPISNTIFNNTKSPIIMNAENIPSEDGIIITCNHKGSFDQFPIMNALGAKRPIHFLMSAKLFTAKEYFRGYIFVPFGAIPVDKRSEESKEKASIFMTQLLLHGYNVALFSEGTRNDKRYDRWLLPTELGTVSTSQKTGSKVLITAQNDFKSKGSHILNVGETFTVSPTDNIVEANNYMREQMAILLGEIEGLSKRDSLLLAGPNRALTDEEIPEYKEMYRKIKKR